MTVYEGASRTMEMNFREKSDMAILPEKVPNKRGKPLAKVVKGIVVLKENIQQFSAVRTSAGDPISREAKWEATSIE